jgi:anaerobic ribonucleoside-triphosphate reductase activating protein
MNVASTQYSLNTKSFEIYLSGCNGSCKGCCNPELKDFNIGEELDTDVLIKIISKIKEFDNLIENIWILGGEPLDQRYEELASLIFLLKTNTSKKIWLFTRYSIDYVDEHLRHYIDYVKCGEYLEELKCDDNIQYRVKLATSNQKIYKLSGGQIEDD